MQRYNSKATAAAADCAVGWTTKVCKESNARRASLTWFVLLKLQRKAGKVYGTRIQVLNVCADTLLCMAKFVKSMLCWEKQTR